MLQRIQSLYLLISSALMAATLFVAFITFQTDGGVLSINAFQIQDVTSAVLTESTPIQTLGIAVCAIASLSFASIFFYKNRLLQLRIIRYTLIIKFALITVLAYFAYVILKDTQVQVSITPQVGLLFMALAMVVDWLAIKAIKKDEELIRSVDRIR